MPPALREFCRLRREHPETSLAQLGKLANPPASKSAMYHRLLRLQKLIEETPEYGIFEYYLVPTYDFRQELLSHGPDVEVLEPKELRDEIKADIALMYKNYGL